MEKSKDENTNVSDDKLEGVDDIKGYGYWKRAEDLIDRDKFIPKVVNDSSTLTLESKTSGGSAWNTAGTWEEKHYKKNTIEEYFNKNLNIPLDKTTTLISLKSFAGDVFLF